MQPVLPVQATRPARMLEAFEVSPIACRRASTSSARSAATPEISRFCQTVRRISPSPKLVRNAGQAAHLRRGHAPHGQRNADPDAACLLLRMHADVRLPMLPVRLGHLIAGNAAQRSAELGLDAGQELVEAPVVEHVFEARLLAVGAVAVIDEHAHDGIGHGNGILGLDQHAGRPREILMAGDAAESEPEPHAGLDACAIAYPHRREGDVIGILQHRNNSAAVEADVELARQAIQRAVVEDVVMPRPCVRSGVEQLLSVNTGCGRAGDIADVVGTRTLGHQSNFGQFLQDRDGVVGRDLAHLQVGTRRHMRIAVAVALGDLGDARQLPVGEDAVRAYAGGTCRSSAPAPRRTARESASGSCRRPWGTGPSRSPT